MSSGDLLVKAYFKSWQTHDVGALNDIFSVSCKYEIKDKTTFNGIDQLRAYWQRNKERQEDLDVFEPIVFETTANSTKVAFCATFLDLEENQSQTVFGKIEFTFEDGKISRLTESYRVHREKSHLILWEKASKAWSRLHNLSHKFLQVHLPRILQFTSFLLAMITFYFYYHTNRLSDFAVCALNGQFAPPGCDVAMAGDRDAMIATAYRFLGVLAGSLLLIIPAVSMYSARLQFGRVRTTELIRDHDDLELMRKSFKRAKGLTIFSGDFSFVRDNADFFQIFRRLASRGALNIISDSSKERVIAGFGATQEAKDLIESLVNDGKILFNSPTAIKCSIVKQWDANEVLYRFEGNGVGAERSPLYMCEVKGRGDIGPVITLIDDLSKARLRG